MNRATEFTVFDVETTGLCPGGADRVIEIAALRIDAAGKKLAEYVTLINPNRDLGPTHKHGLKAADVLDAPRFDEVVGDIVELMEDSVLAAHNASFDIRFLESEFKRSGHGLPAFKYLCTMQCAKRANPSIAMRSLEDLCSCFGIELRHAHSAQADAEATAQLLSRSVEKLGGIDSLSKDLTWLRQWEGRFPSWPKVAPSRRSLRRQSLRRKRTPSSHLVRAVQRLPEHAPMPHVADEYLELLDRAIEDRRLSKEETDALFLLAADLGMGKEIVTQAHEEYMRHLVRLCLDDEVISKSEWADLREVAMLLGLSRDWLGSTIDQESEKSRSDREASRNPKISRELAGKSVCFTGQLQCLLNGDRISREDAEALAEVAGLEIRRGVSKKLDFLVVADPDSLSGKAKKARQFGVRIIAESAFWHMIGLQVE